MPRKSTHLNSEQILKKFKAGDGQGEGASYKPWLTVREFTSSGRSHRVLSHKTGRIHHLFSDLELSFFLLLDWSDSVVDIRERFPLKREEAQEIAEHASLPYPIKSNTPQVIYSDFLVDVKDTANKDFIINVRPSSTLSETQVVNSLELERRYWKSKGIQQFVATEKQINSESMQNIEMLAQYIGDIEAITDKVIEQMQVLHRQLYNDPNMTIVDACMKIDRSYDLSIGESFTDFKILLANRVINFDIRKPIQCLRYSDLSFNENLEWLGDSNVANQ